MSVPVSAPESSWETVARKWAESKGLVYTNRDGHVKITHGTDEKGVYIRLKRSTFTTGEEYINFRLCLPSKLIPVKEQNVGIPAILPALDEWRSSFKE